MADAQTAAAPIVEAPSLAMTRCCIAGGWTGEDFAGPAAGSQPGRRLFFGSTEVTIAGTSMVRGFRFGCGRL